MLVPVSGAATWTIESSGAACSIHGTASWPLGPDDGEMYLYDRIVSGPAYRGYGGRGQLDKAVTYTITCPGGSQVVETSAGIWWEPPTGIDVEPYWKTVKDDGVTIDDTDHRIEGGFVAVDETRALSALRE